MNKIIKNVKLISTLIFTSAILLVSSPKAECTNGRLPSPFDPTCSNAQAPTIGDIIAKFVPLIPVAIGLVLFAMLVWGGFQIFTSGPNDEAKKKGFQTIQNAITGVVILLFSIGIITILEAVLGVKILFGVFVR